MPVHSVVLLSTDLLLSWLQTLLQDGLKCCQTCVKSHLESRVSPQAGTDFHFSLPSPWGLWVNSNFLKTISSIFEQFKEGTQVSLSGMSLSCYATPLAQQQIIFLHAPMLQANGRWCWHRMWCMLGPCMFSYCSFSTFKSVWPFCLISSVEKS